jgi:hypothetical protein
MWLLLGLSMMNLWGVPAWPACAQDDVAPAPRAMRLVVAAPRLPHEQDPQPLHQAAIEHSEAYQRRAKIHKYASFATLPLFAAELALGESLYNTPENDSRKAAHAIVGAGIIGLAGVNTVTGAWNLFGEGWSDTNGRTLRLVHGLLMMASDVGFVATELAAPGNLNARNEATFDADKNRHRNLAIGSIAIATTGYLIMLFGNR